MAEYNLKDIEPTQKTLEQEVNKNLKEEKMARSLLWLALKLDEVEYVLASELQNFLAIDRMHAYRILERFVGWRLLDKTKIGNIVMFKPVFNNNEMVLKSYVRKAKTTVGLKK